MSKNRSKLSILWGWRTKNRKNYYVFAFVFCFSFGFFDIVNNWLRGRCRRLEQGKSSGRKGGEKISWGRSNKRTRALSRWQGEKQKAGKGRRAVGGVMSGWREGCAPNTKKA